MLVSRFGVNVSLTKAEGVDLLCIDQEGRILPKGKNVVINVRTRERAKDKVYETVNADWDEIQEVSKNWNADPYFAYIRIVPEEGLITCFLQPVSKARAYGKNYNPKKAEQDASSKLFEMKFESFTRIKNWKP